MLYKDFISKIEIVLEYEKHGAGRGWDNVSDALFIYDSKNGINGVDFLTLYKSSDFVIVFFDENLKLYYAIDGDEKIYGNLHQRLLGGLSEKAIEEHCINNGINYEK